MKASKLLSVAILALCLLFAGSFMNVQEAHAIPSSKVTDVLDDNGDGTWTYNYTVWNTSEWEWDQTPTDEVEREMVPYIVDWELPWFDDAGITDIQSPDGWAFAIETIGVVNPATRWGGIATWQDPSDPWYQGPDSPFTTVEKVLHWYSTELPEQGDGGLIPPPSWIEPEEELDGFSFVADFPPTNAPYQASWFFFPVQTGDPRFPLGGFPNSPSVQAPIPEPSTVLLLGFGLLALIGLKRKIRDAK